MATHDNHVTTGDDGPLSGPLIFFFVIGLVVIAAFGGFKFYNSPPATMFAAIEFGVLCFVSACSTANYYLTYKVMGDAEQPLSDRVFFGLILLNLVLFIAATALLERTELFLLVVLAIYLAFSMVNIVQVKKLIADQKSSPSYFRATVTSAIWLKEENGPSVVAFTIVLALLLGITGYHLLFSEHELEDKFYYQVKAFAGGAATFHLVLSVLKYGFVLIKQDVVEESIRSIAARQREAEQAFAVVGSAVSISTEPLKNLFKISERLDGIFRASYARWRAWLVLCGVLAVIFAFASWKLNDWHHPNVPPPKVMPPSP